MKAVVMDLLRQYLKVEIQFQNGEDRCSLFLCLDMLKEAAAAQIILRKSLQETEYLTLCSCCLLPACCKKCLLVLDALLY